MSRATLGAIQPQSLSEVSQSDGRCDRLCGLTILSAGSPPKRKVTMFGFGKKARKAVSDIKKFEKRQVQRKALFFFVGKATKVGLRLSIRLIL